MSRFTPSQTLILFVHGKNQKMRVKVSRIMFLGRGKSKRMPILQTTPVCQVSRVCSCGVDHCATHQTRVCRAGRWPTNPVVIIVQETDKICDSEILLLRLLPSSLARAALCLFVVKLNTRWLKTDASPVPNLVVVSQTP
ncbi:hypothetical protein RRG08_020094 [Elysia crispata]|uniref:Uncharacterized protein n=1 Tax=Elysia crispata TaxID=231223 RepID=A0AAE1DTK8_9GAST|nr:hypothetical protein RRG08_020094 [Elysia crispata]